MKLFKALSTVTVALFATFANANTTNVTTAQLTQLQPVDTVELVKSVEANLANSMEQLKVTFTLNNVASKPLVAVNNTTKNEQKQLVAKVSLAAE